MDANSCCNFFQRTLKQATVPKNYYILDIAELNSKETCIIN